MRTINFLMTAAALLLFVGCNKEKGGTPDVPVNPAPTFTQISFLAVDNADIITADIVKPNPAVGRVDVTFPIEVEESKFNKMAMRYVLSDQAASVTIKVTEIVGENEEAHEEVVDKPVASGDTLDFSSVVDFYVSKEGKTSVYSVACKLASSGGNWNLWATTPSGLELNNDPEFAVTDDGTVYLAGFRYTSTSADQYPMLLKAQGGTITNAVQNDYLREVRGANVGIALSGSTPYVAFRDYSKTSNGVSVMKVINGSASYVGDTCAVYRNSSDCAILISGNHIWTGNYDSANGGPKTRRLLNLAHYDGNTWANDVEIAGRAATAYGYYPVAFDGNGKKYMFVFNQNTNSFSCYSFNEGVQTTIFEALVIKNSENADVTVNMYPGTRSYWVDADGTIFMLIYGKFDGTTEKWGVVKISIGESITQSIVGGIYSYETGGSRPYGTIVKDKNGKLQLIHCNSVGKVCASTLDSNTQLWTAPIVIAGSDYRSSGNAFPTLRSCFKNGKVYLVAQNQKTHQIDIFVSE